MASVAVRGLSRTVKFSVSTDELPMKQIFIPVLSLVTCAAAADLEVPEGTYVQAEKAGVDYAIQGEYLGKLSAGEESAVLGLQVIALGNHEFDAVAYMGGLPGAGANMERKIPAKGKTEDGVTTLVASTGTAVIKDGVCEILDKDGNSVGKLRKTVRKSPTLGRKAPEGATVLFNGQSADRFARGKVVLKDLLLADCETKAKFGSHKMHLEFRTPFKPKARGQGRGNSGVYIQSRYECQVLDSFGLEGKNNECGGIYSIAEPAVNACFPPLTWQTYDIDYTAPEWKDGKKVKNARVTIHHNGILIHDNIELPHGTPGKHPEVEGPDGLYLQGHGNPVVYRNIWVVEK